MTAALRWTDERGRVWKTFTCSYDTADGTFGFSIMALSDEHAAAMLAELKETARVDGELVKSIKANKGTDHD